MEAGCWSSTEVWSGQEAKLGGAAATSVDWRARSPATAQAATRGGEPESCGGNLSRRCTVAALSSARRQRKVNFF